MTTPASDKLDLLKFQSLIFIFIFKENTLGVTWNRVQKKRSDIEVEKKKRQIDRNLLNC